MKKSIKFEFSLHEIDNIQIDAIQARKHDSNLWRYNN